MWFDVVMAKHASEIDLGLVWPSHTLHLKMVILFMTLMGWGEEDDYSRVTQPVHRS
jgi:hypothetical protein